jgi:predicted acylesterase/phospholipase RssA
MTIKHLVICGGGPSVFRTIGALYKLEDLNFWKIANIETIYGTSAGALFGAMLCLKFDHETITNYIINRPWHEAYPIKVSQIMEMYTKKGLYDHKFAEIIFKPLLLAKNLPLTITLKELFEFSNIELHLFSLELNQFKPTDISYKTHPDLTLLDSIAMSCAIPMLFAPFCKNKECYVDGGIVINYPLNNCINDGHSPDEILGTRFNYVSIEPCIKMRQNECSSSPIGENKNEKGFIIEKKEEIIDISYSTVETDEVPCKSTITHESTIMDFLINIIGKLINQAGTEFKQTKIPYELLCDTMFMEYYTFKQCIYSQSYRKDMIDCGVEHAKHFFAKHGKDLIKEEKEEDLNAGEDGDTNDVTNH